MSEHWFYYFVKYTSWFGLKLFFGGVEIIGKKRVPKDGALIFAPNHQGAFMDALLVGVYSTKPVSFLTRADVFKKWTIPFLESLNMMPIYRIRDGIQSLSQNEQVFEKCFNILAKRKSILIFPEGNHSREYYLRPLSKGTSRLALDARYQLDPEQKIYVIPTGINYFSHFRPLSRVKVHFGEPIELSKYMELYNEHRQKAYNQFREDLTVAMKATMILPNQGKDYEQKRDYIFQPKHNRMSSEELKEMGKADHYEVRKSRKPGLFTRLFVALFSIPNLPALLALRKILSGVKDKVFFLSLKYLVGGIFHMIWWLILFGIGAIWLGWEAGLLFAGTAILLMFARQELIKY